MLLALEPTESRARSASLGRPGKAGWAGLALYAFRTNAENAMTLTNQHVGL